MRKPVVEPVSAYYQAQPRTGKVEVAKAMRATWRRTELSKPVFSNRPLRVKRFQTIRSCSVDVTRGFALLSGFGKCLSKMGSEDEVEQSQSRSVVKLTAGSDRFTNSPYPSSHEGQSQPLRFRYGHAATAPSFVHWKSVPSTHMRCKTTAMRRARAIIALFIPLRWAAFTPQALIQDHFGIRISADLPSM